MPHVHQTAMESGPFSLTITLVVILAALVYLRSKRSVRMWRKASFLLGLSCIWIALSSPVATLHHDLLTGHMIQHLLLMTFAAPLISMGAVFDRRFLASTSLHVVAGFSPPPFAGLVQCWRSPERGLKPATTCSSTVAQSYTPREPLPLCWLGATLMLAVWHIPAVFTLAMQSQVWHVIQQATFLATGLLFWWPVVQASAGWPMILYLFLATLPCDILAGFLVFSDRVVYSVYLPAPRRYGLSVLADQQCAGALMWTCVTIVYLIAGTILTTRLLSSHTGLQSVEALSHGR